MTAKIVDISLCPTSLEFPNGDTYDADALLDALRQFISSRHPDATVNLQIGHRQGDAWSLVDGDAGAGGDLVVAFFEQHGTDEELFVESDDDAEQTIEIEANESAELLGLSLNDCPDDEPYRSECTKAWWDAFYAEVGADDRLSGVEFVHPRGNRLMLSQWNGAQFKWKRTVLGSFTVPTQEQRDAIDAASTAADLSAAEVWGQIQAQLAETSDDVDE